jgi:hypothetical protein
VKPTTAQIAAAMAELGAIPFFPSDPAAQLVIARHVAKFVGGVKELRWLVDASVTVMQRWAGIPELRGLYCTRYKPADGIEATCMLPGYTPEELEMAAAYALPEPSGNPLLIEGEIEVIQSAIGSPVEPKKVFKRLPVPTREDREYSRKLLEHLT